MCLNAWISIREQYLIIISSGRQTKNYLADLELLQYDIMYGDQYVYEDRGCPITEGHMVYGRKRSP